MLRNAGQRPAAGSARGARGVRGDGDGEDPRVTGLRTSVTRLRRELAAYRADFTDRRIAEDELAALADMAAGGAPEVLRLRRSLLLVASAIGSVSALAPGLAEVRGAVEMFGTP